ncbi:hypothetical protein Dsin_001327 [Dipteronia sinensis]|uniref:NB-ARC domain-containing protein n=1 Tax=Dipteronia sinensis TaxID=43782 RepID=A0AAE0EIC3_9ROSI|nr:hypothetical protein Dsin_001327 [Dipteronia sinensis]
MLGLLPPWAGPVYGPGGIGKIMLARAVVKQAEDKKLYDVVAFGEVTEKPNIKEILQEIADKLGLTFREESTSGRARNLQERLKQEKKSSMERMTQISLRQKGNKIGENVNSKPYRLRLLGNIRTADILNVKHLVPYNGDPALEDEEVLNSRLNSV